MRWTPALALALLACGDDPKATPDAMTDSPTGMVDAAPDASDPNMPRTLAETGLCMDAACTQISPLAIPYTPQYPLWSDAATKKRWIQLPPGTKIDTTDMDFWEFPVGTKVWKEFTSGTTRVETRLIMRTGTGTTVNDWFYAAYVWNEAQDNAVWEELGAVDVLGTQHDVPSKFQCRTCHENAKPSRVLGFSAIQLDYDNTTAGELDLADVVAQDLLTNPPTGGQPYFPLPGDATARAALGYLHANCGNCHNPNSQIYTNDQTQMELRLTVGTLGALSTTPTYQTAVSHPAKLPVGGRNVIVAPGMPDSSSLIYRFESTNPAEHMPALGSEVMDPAGRTMLRDWVTSIQ
ncbi:MAG: hypothetical protein HOV81_20690 [Kofleriaceae bacterium]|nr:hypothetical protein [Kofleriaceae bacterium]